MLPRCIDSVLRPRIHNLRSRRTSPINTRVLEPAEPQSSAITPHHQRVRVAAAESTHTCSARRNKRPRELLVSSPPHHS